jgi:hypothetical protein
MNLKEKIVDVLSKNNQLTTEDLKIFTNAKSNVSFDQAIKFLIEEGLICYNSNKQLMLKNKQSLYPYMDTYFYGTKQINIEIKISEIDGTLLVNVNNELERCKTEDDAYKALELLVKKALKPIIETKLKIEKLNKSNFDYKLDFDNLIIQLENEINTSSTTSCVATPVHDVEF